MSTPVIETNRLVRVFIRIRAERKTIAEKFTLKDDELKRKLKTIENELLRRAQEEGVEGYKTADGTTYIAEEQHVSIADPDEFMPFVRESGDLYFYEQRPSLGHIKEYQNEHKGELPPGVRMFREYRMRIRASKAKKGADDDRSDD